jgi:hypothetical protein
VHEQKIRCAYLDADTDGDRHEITQDDMDKSTLIDGSVSQPARSCRTASSL